MTSTVSVHRCRFVDYTPTAITAIAFPPLPPPPVKGKRKDAGASLLTFGTLAVGRANGNVELHEWTGLNRQGPAPQAWIVQKVLPGPRPSKVDNLVFALRQKRDDSWAAQLKNLRLFSTGGGSEILEWDLEHGGIVRSISSQAGSVWSMAVNPSSTLLALGCEDGSVRILSLADDDLRHYRRFDRIKSRLLSITWGPPVMQRASHIGSLSTGDDSSSEDDEVNGWADSWLVAGCSDSSLRKFDFSSGRVLDRMTTERSRGEKTLVWAVGTLGDGTIVSGDSLGFVTFWDSNTCTQLQSFKTHGADVLCLTFGPEGRSVYSSGVDQKVCQFSSVQLPRPEGTLSSTPPRTTWIHNYSRRLHSHDVRTISVWPPYSLHTSTQQMSSSSLRIAPVLVSGGFDMSVVTCPCPLPSIGTDAKTVNPLTSRLVSTFEDGHHQRLPYTTGMSPAVQVAREAKLVLCRRDNGLTIWKIRKSAFPGEFGLSDLLELEKDRGDDWERVVDMELKVTTNLIASAIASDGTWVAASDLHETKLYRLIHKSNDIRPKRVRISVEPGRSAPGATYLSFTDDSSKLIIGAFMGSSVVAVVDLAGEDNNNPRVLRTFEHHRLQNVIVGGPASRAIKNLPGHVEVNGDVQHHSGDEGLGAEEKPRAQSSSLPSVASTITRMATSVDGQWLASADTRHRIHVFSLDSVQHHCALPSFPHSITALAFDPGSPNTLVIGLGNNTLQAFDVESRQFPEWSRGWSQESSTPFRHLHDPLLGISFDPEVTEAGEGEAAGGRRALVWGSSWICKVNLTAPRGHLSKKRRRDSVRFSAAAAPQRGETSLATQDLADDPNTRVVTRYRPLLLVEYLGPGELVVVERPLVDLLSTLPPAYFKHAYGT